MPLIGSCHCGATRFEVETAPESVVSCTCSICSRKAALWAYYAPAEVRFLSDDAKSTYQWQSTLVKLNFCSVCGCSTYNESPDFSTGEPNFDNPRISLNARLFEDFDLAAVPVEVLDGKNLW
jgi:hypothetical protein